MDLERGLKWAWELNPKFLFQELGNFSADRPKNDVRSALPDLVAVKTLLEMRDRCAARQPEKIYG